MNAQRFQVWQILIATSLLTSVRLNVSKMNTPPGLRTREISEITRGRSRTCSRTSQQKTALIAFFKDKPLQFEPGTKAEYSNSNYAVLGQIVEKVSGKPLEQFVKERIIQPLDLQATRFVIGLEEIIPHRAKSYLIYPDGSLKNPPFMIPWSQAYGAGTVHSTVGDIAKFVAVFSNVATYFPEAPNPYFPGPLVKEIALMLVEKR